MENTFFTLDEIKKMNEIVGNLYNDDLSLTDYMSSFMNSLRNLVYFDKSDFMFFTCDKKSNQCQMQNFSPVQWTPEEIDHYVRTYMHIDDVLPILARKEPIAFRNTDLFAKSERQKTRYYKEFVEAAQLEISIDANIPLSKTNNIIAILGLFRNSDRKEFSLKELEMIKVYQKHLSISLDKQLVMEGKSDVQDLFSGFEHFESFGLVVLDTSQNILSFNSVFRKYATMESHPLHDGELSKNIKSLSRRLLGLNERSIGPIPIDDGDVTYLVEVSKYSQNEEKHIGVVYSLSDYFVKRLTTLKTTYKISKREYEILFLMLKKGLTNEQIAESLFITTGTVKRHLSSAYGKIGIKNQKQLLNILKVL